MNTLTVNSAQTNRNIYDSELTYPIIYPANITQDIVATFSIPSSRYYYPSLDGHVVPYIASGDTEQIRRDVAAWLEEGNFSTIYALESVDSVDPQVDLISIINGHRINTPQNINRYVRDFGAFLDELRNVSNPNERFGLPTSTREIIELMLKYPFTKAANFILASKLANEPDVNRIQNYLDQVGIVHFKAENIINLPHADIFFYLTRFYGPPVVGDLSTRMVGQKYLRVASNEITKQLASDVSINIATYNLYQKEFGLFFAALNQDPNYPIQQNFGTESRQRLFASFFEYLKLLGKPTNLPPLTLNTIKQLNTPSTSQIRTFLSNYTDNDIIRLVGTGHRIDESYTRGQLIDIAARQLTSNRTFLLLPAEAELCNNRNTIVGEEFRELQYVFLGKGSFTTGFTCYDISEIFDSFNTNTDSEGITTFRDPADYSRNFTVQDLKDFRSAITSGRAGIPADPTIVKGFNTYIARAELQNNVNFNSIRNLRAWANQSPDNKAIMRQILMQYFYMGMYMRQWKGPGNPYPILKSQTGRTVEGTGQTQEFVALNVTEAKRMFMENFNKLPSNLRDDFWQLRIYFYENGKVEDKGATIASRWKSVIDDGDYCVRLASGTWAFTGAYYMKQILNEEIPGFDLSQGLEYIY
jgi:hypothetical protein